MLIAGLAWQFSAAQLPIQLSPHLAFAIAFISVSAIVLGVARFAPQLPGRLLLLVALPIFGLFVLGISGSTPTDLTAGAATMACLLAAGSLVGAAIGARIQAPGHLLVAAYVSSLADLYSVLAPSGPSARLVQAEALLPVVAIPFPMIGSGGNGLGELVPILGAGDVVMTALYLAATRVHQLPIVRATVALATAYGFVLVGLFIMETALPALPALGLCFVISQPRTWRLPKPDRSKALVGCIVLTLLAILASQH